MSVVAQQKHAVVSLMVDLEPNKALRYTAYNQYLLFLSFLVFKDLYYQFMDN